MQQHFRVRLGGELVTFFDEAALQRKVIFDDSVMGDHNAILAVAVRMRILFSGPSVRGPARVTEAEIAGKRLFLHQVFQIF